MRKHVQIEHSFWLLSAALLGSFAGCQDTETYVQGTSHSSLATQQHDDSDRPILWTREGIDWASFLGPNRNSKSDETEFNWDRENKLPSVWTYQVGEGYGSGSVAAGRYYHFHRIGDTARLVCLHAETGKQLWEFKYPSVYKDSFGFDGGPRCSPVVDDDRVYIFGVEGMLHCLNATNGDLLWSVDTQKHFRVIQNFFGVGSTPLIYKDLLLTMVGGSPESSLKIPSEQLNRVEPNNCAIVAFDKHSGHIKYQTGNDLASYASPILAELHGRVTGLAFCREKLIAFDPVDGKVKWSFPWRARKFASVNASTPIVWNNQILITESYGPGGALLKIENDRPQVVWSDKGRREKSIACHFCTPVEVDGYAYLSSGESSGGAELRCVDLSTGEIKWSQPGYRRASLLLVDDRFICLGEYGALMAFKPNPEKFEKIADYSIDGARLAYPCWAAPIVSHGYLYIRDKSQVICVDLRK